MVGVSDAVPQEASGPGLRGVTWRLRIGLAWLVGSVGEILGPVASSDSAADSRVPLPWAQAPPSGLHCANWSLGAVLRTQAGSGCLRTVVENSGWVRLWGQSRGKCLANFTLGYVIVCFQGRTGIGRERGWGLERERADHGLWPTPCPPQLPTTVWPKSDFLCRGKRTGF